MEVLIIHIIIELSFLISGFRIRGQGQVFKWTFWLHFNFLFLNKAPKFFNLYLKLLRCDYLILLLF